MRRFRAKNKAHTAKRIAIMILIALVVAGAAAGISFYLKAKDAVGVFYDMPFYSEAVYASRGERIYYIDNGELTLYDPASPESASSSKLEASSVSIASSDSMSVIWAGSQLQIIGASTSVDAGGAILSAHCGTGFVAVMRQDAAGSVALNVYDGAANLVDVIEESDALLVDCGFSAASGSDVLWTLTLDTTSSVPVTTLTTYTYSGSVATMSGVFSIRGQLVSNVVFTSSSIFVCGTEQLIRCDAGVSSEAWRVLTYGYRLYDSSAGGSKPLFVYRPNGDETLSSVKLYSVLETGAADATARTVLLPEGTVSAVAARGRLYAFTADTAYEYSANGKLAGSFPLGFTCTAVTKLSDTRLLIESNGAMKLVVLN